MSLGPGTSVRLKDNPAQQGVLTGRPPRRRTYGLQREVLWEGAGRSWHYEEELEPCPEEAEAEALELLRAGRLGSAPQLRLLLGGALLGQDLSGVVQAMEATGTDFYAHQYKPLLILLDSPADGLLIADEVGLGKTIEAGLIWTELKARYDARRLVVVCPAMLREKWCYELATRFGAEPRVVKAAELLEALRRRPNREQVLVASYQGLRPPHADSQPGSRGPLSPRQELARWLEERPEGQPIIDLLVLDEAHYVRNRSTANWRLAELLRRSSERQLLLSATPINLRLEDLRNLLQLLDPDRFTDQRAFQRIIELNRPVVRASDRVLAGPWREALAALRALRESRPGSRRIHHLVAQAERLGDPPPDDERVRLAAELERLNLIAHVVCRTRKRDVQADRVRRRARTLRAPMSEVERRLYDEVTEAVRRFAQQEGIAHAFLVALPQRLVSSCAVALLRAWRRGAEDPDAVAVQSDETDAGEERIRQVGGRLRAWLQEEVLHRFDEQELAAQDGKLRQLSAQLRRALAQEPRRKVVLFTEFRETARYLRETLRRQGLGVELLMGGSDFDKDGVIRRFRTDPGIRVLVSTDVASEGVDLQCSDLLVNYDLPWNPMRIEQRIGRIDRIGQRASEILIWNVVQEGTIDEQVCDRLHHRIRIFEETLGETEAILGEVRKLEDALLSRPMTREEEEREIARRAAAIERLRQSQEALEQEAVRLEAHGRELIQRIQAMRAERRWLDGADLAALLGEYLRGQPGCRFDPVPGEETLAELALSPDLAARYGDFLNRTRAPGGRRLATGTPCLCRFADRVNDRPRRDEELVHRFHPLVRFVGEELARRAWHPVYAARLAARESGLGPGRYLLVAGALHLDGLRRETHLLARAAALDSGAPLAEPKAQALLRALARDARPWPAAAAEVDGEQARAVAEACLHDLEEEWDRLVGERKQEQEERAELHLALLEEKRQGVAHRHAELIRRHREAGRDGLAKAEQAKRDKELHALERRAAKIRQDLARFQARRQELCFVVVEVADHGLEGAPPRLVAHAAGPGSPP